MGEVASTIFKSLTKLAAIVTVLLGFVTLFTLLVSGVRVLLNKTVIEDMLLLVQMWLPFNIDPIFLWLGFSVSMYITYRVALIAYSMINSVIRG